MHKFYSYTRLGLCLALFLSLCTGVRAQCAGNVVNNADFEGGLNAGMTLPDGYYDFGNHTFSTSTNTPSGSGTAAQSDFGGSFGALAQQVDVTAGLNYTFSADVLRDATTPGTYANLRIYWKDGTGTDLPAPDNGIQENANMTGAYENVSVTGIAPAGAVFAQLAVQGDGLVTSDNWCFFEVQPTTNPGCAGNLALNGDLEGGDGMNGLPNDYFTFGTAAYTASANTPSGSGTAAQVQFSNGFGAIAQQVAITAGTEYSFTADVLRDATTPGSYANVRIYWLDANGADVASMPTGIQENVNMVGTYETATVTGVAPVDAAIAQIAVQGDGLVTTDNFCFIEVLPVVTEVCDDNLVVNPTLDDGMIAAYFTYSQSGGTVATANATGGSNGTGAINVNPLTQAFYGIGQQDNPAGGIVAGTEYFATVDAQRVDAAANGYANLVLKFVDANGDVGTPVQVPIPSGMLTTLTTSAMAPAGATGVQILIAAGNDAEVVADNFCLTATDPNPGAGSTLCPGNLIPNGAMESNTDNTDTPDVPDGYYTYTNGTFAAAITNSPFDNSNAVQATVTGPAGGFGGFATFVSGIVEGSTYDWNVDIRVDQGQANLYVSWRDANNAEVATDFSGTVTDADGITSLGISRVAPTGLGVVSAQLAINFFNAAVTVDNFCFTESACADNLYANGSFEEGLAGAFVFNATQMIVDDPNTGAQALMVTAGGGGGGRTIDAGANTFLPGETIEVTAQVKSTNGGLTIAYTYASGPQTFGGTGRATDPNNYSAVGTGPLVVPAGVTGIGIFTTSDAAVVIDDICVRRTMTLPVTLSSFTGVALAKANRLEWTTATEENTARFHLERSADGRGNWTEVAALAAAGNSRTTRYYSAEDDRPYGQTYYRLRSVDVDGSEQLSNVVLLRQGAVTDFRAYPNPVSNQLTVETDLERASAYQLFDQLGRVVRRGTITAGATRTVFSVEDLPRGRYVLRVGERSLSVIK